MADDATIEEAHVDALDQPTLGTASAAVAAPFAAAVRAHHETGWPQVIGLIDCNDGRCGWVTTTTWFGQDRLREDILDALLPSIGGTVLDVGAGVGRAALKLQEAGLDVLAIDCEPACVEIARARGVARVALADIREFETDERFETILFLDSTFGLVGNTESVGPMLRKLESLLAPGGRVLVQDFEFSGVSESEWRFVYRGEVGQPFRWMHFGFSGLSAVVRLHGWTARRCASGPGAFYVAELQPAGADGDRDTVFRWLLLIGMVAALICVGVFSQ